VLIDIKRREFIAKLVCDLGKTIFAVGIASYLFEKFPTGVRIGLSAACLFSLVISVFVQPPKNKGENPC
jgi:hypothetical protein